MSVSGGSDEVGSCTLDEYTEDSYIPSPENEIQTRVDNAMVTTIISELIPGDLFQNIDIPLEYLRKDNCCVL